MDQPEARLPDAGAATRAERVNIAVTATDNISVGVTIKGHTVRAHRNLRRANRGPDVLR